MKEKIKTILQSLGYDPNLIEDNHFKLVDSWLRMYKGKTKDHYYYTYNGLKNYGKKGLKMYEKVYCNKEFTNSI